MNFIKRAYGRLTGVLGYDYQGKPLRKGDIVYPRFPQQVREPFKFGMEVLRETPKEFRSKGEVCVMSPCGDEGHAFGEQIKKEPPMSKSASWREAQRITGWAPAEQGREAQHA